jgi:hypothetical protein
MTRKKILNQKGGHFGTINKHVFDIHNSFDKSSSLKEVLILAAIKNPANLRKTKVLVLSVAKDDVKLVEIFMAPGFEPELQALLETLALELIYQNVEQHEVLDTMILLMMENKGTDDIISAEAKQVPIYI